jgi:poly(A) polymerase
MHAPDPTPKLPVKPEESTEPSERAVQALADRRERLRARREGRAKEPKSRSVRTDGPAADGAQSEGSRSEGSRGEGGRGDRVRSDNSEHRPAPKERPWEKAPGAEPLVHPTRLDGSRLDENASRVVGRLTKAGHEAYLVGGCVRDLLVGRTPKDFDVATSASPEQVRSLFKNSRIIGRRFRLVHVLFGGGQVIETATFRRSPPPLTGDEDEGLLIRSDNVFGDAHEDALRRDFTINALFYDIDGQRVLDWTRGMHDIESKTVRTIGEPRVRFQEDPIRILRAIKFAARLDFGLDPDLYDAAVECRGALAMAARPRLSEEILRLLRGGAAHRSIWLCYEMGILDVLLPELSTYIADARQNAVVFAVLTELDKRTRTSDAPLDDILLWAGLLLEPLLEACDGEKDRLRTGQEFLEAVVERLALPRRIADGVARLVAMLPRHLSGRAQRFKKSPLHPLLTELAAVSQAARRASISS